MFREIYKSANDDIKADGELLDKVLSQKPRKRPPVYRYSTVAAAVVAVCVGFAAVPMMNGNKSKDIPDSTAVSTNPPQTSDQEAPAGKRDISSGQQTENNSGAVHVKTADTTDNAGGRAEPPASENAVDTRSNEAPASYNMAQSRQLSKAAEADSEFEKISEAGGMIPVEMPAETAKKKAIDATGASADIMTVNTYVRTIVLHANSIDYGVESGDAEYWDNDLGGAGEYTVEEWTMEDYFNHLGENVFDKISLPSDFKYVGDYDMTVSVDKDGVPSMDSRIFPYEGDGDRFVSVITSKNTSAADTYIGDERYQKSDIDGTPAVVIGQDEQYKSYIVSNDVSHIITSNDITEDELSDLLVSIGGKDE